MATMDVTAEEIEGAPLLLNPPVKQVKPSTRSRLNFALCIVLVIDTVLQLIAIITPGWSIQTGEIMSSYESVYYGIVCTDTTPLENVSTTECRSASFLDEFYKSYNSAKDFSKPALASAYNLRVLNQMNIQFSWLIVAGTTIFQIVRYIKKNEAYPRITAINAMVLICACSAMYQVLYRTFVLIDFVTRQTEYSSAEVGFPYSVFLYFIASMQSCVVTVIVFKQLYDYMRHIQLALIETKVQVETLQMKYDAEVEEFRHYRRLHSEKNHLRERGRVSQRFDRSSKREDNRPRQSRYVKDHSIHSPRRSENEHNERNKERVERPHGRSSRKHENTTKKERFKKTRDISPRTSGLSETSRDSSLDVGNHSHRPHELPDDISEVTRQQQIFSGEIHETCDLAKKQQELSQTKLTNSDKSTEESKCTDSVDINTIPRAEMQTKRMQATDDPSNGEQVNVTDGKQETKTKNNPETANNVSVSSTSSATRTVSADVHVPHTNKL